MPVSLLTLIKIIIKGMAETAFLILLLVGIGTAIFAILTLPFLCAYYLLKNLLSFLLNRLHKKCK